MELPDLGRLIERFDGFNYGYWMNCSCGGRSFITAHDYFIEADGAHMSCEQCGQRIRFGPAVAALRDKHDPALQDDVVTRFAWYHTSTSSDWPSPDYARRFAENLSWSDDLIGLSRKQYILNETTKALHLGTYETAIENMLRRMRDQGDGSSQFYLYRVALRPKPLRINPGYRDENHEDAANLKISDLNAENLDVVRYLNVHEATGVLSLAVRPKAIAAVQCIEIPLNELTVPIDTESFSADVARLKSARSAWVTAEAKIASIDRGTRVMMQFGARPDPGGLAKYAGELERHHQTLWYDFEARLGEQFLANVSPVIRRDFTEALACWRRENPTTGIYRFVERYAAMAALLEEPDKIQRTLRHMEWLVVHQTAA
ncbi:hypothetical protein [Bifidobacterium psychraerophilum]|uniref:Uncharacterized protein n=1 Tax=Bifidobacterium psychraerophilum TaxID=218140 RepID=A0A087CI70_9BIFI|nr:hypothetical protein [Bifidobacterium psychraerophilum]KFI82970.1 hypothetical protein BPSY_0761 [Bifidobacterium psychraerophilum]PKA94718.1 hypothetical protein A9A89_0943 [Bifidobacterium psychraerophilum DSM 22366]